MTAKTEETTFSNIKSIISTFWPFVGMAFAFVQFIYARDSAEKASERAENKQSISKLKDDVNELQKSRIEDSGRIKRVEEITVENRSSITENAKRISDVEKTYIYTMPAANAYRR